MSSPILRHWRVLTVGACCAAAGVGAGAVATAGASTAHSSSGATSAKAGQARGHGLRALERRAVHGTAVVHTKAGFVTVTYDRGVVDSVSGDQIQLTEGTPKATYKTVTLTVPSDVTVRDNGQKSTMSSITAGQRAIVVQLPTRTVVVARTPRQAAG